MPFSDISGHSAVIDNMRNMVDSMRMPHALLFTEQWGYGAFPIVLATLQYMFCKEHVNGDACGKCSNCVKIGKLVHPDIHFTFPASATAGDGKRNDIESLYPVLRRLATENPYFGEHHLYKALDMENKLGTINVAQANSIIRKLSLSSYEGGAKVMIILFPERMNLEAANKLLKNLEEPQSGTYYFLISHNPHKIIPTIVSRCRTVELLPMEQPILQQILAKKFGLDENRALFWAKCSGGSYGKAVELVLKEEEQEENWLIFTSILNKALNRDLAALIEIWEQIAAMGKEVQKGLCVEGIAIIRKLYMTSLGLEEISYASYKERKVLEDLSGKIKDDFYYKGYGYLNNAIECIERNVNPKFIFCDLCNRIFYNI